MTTDIATGQTWTTFDGDTRVVMCVGDFDGRRYVRWSRPASVGVGHRCGIDEFRQWVESSGAWRSIRSD